MATVGRPRDSCVWNYFEYLEEKDKNVCLVTLGDGEHGQRGHSTKEGFHYNQNASHYSNKNYNKNKIRFITKTITNTKIIIITKTTPIKTLLLS